MTNQTKFVNNLRDRMKYSYDNKFYLESIACSYAIIENRTKKICEHLGKKCKEESLNEKTMYIYNFIKNKGSETDKKIKKLIGFLEYRFDGKKLMNVDTSVEYKVFNDNVDLTSLDNQLITFRRLRNDFTHELYKYDSNNPRLTNFNDFKDLAESGIYVAENLCSIASALKRKMDSLTKKF